MSAVSAAVLPAKPASIKAVSEPLIVLVRLSTLAPP